MVETDSNLIEIMIYFHDFLTTSKIYEFGEVMIWGYLNDNTDDCFVNLGKIDNFSFNYLHYLKCLF